MHSAQTLGIPMNGSTSPDYFILKVGMTENSIHDSLEIVAHGGVAVEIDAPCGLQDTAALHQSVGHVGQIGQLRTFP